jgi:hypothetical protein
MSKASVKAAELYLQNSVPYKARQIKKTIMGVILAPFALALVSMLFLLPGFILLLIEYLVKF